MIFFTIITIYVIGLAAAPFLVGLTGNDYLLEDELVFLSLAWPLVLLVLMIIGLLSGVSGAINGLAKKGRSIRDANVK